MSHFYSWFTYRRWTFSIANRSIARGYPSQTHGIRKKSTHLGDLMHLAAQLSCPWYAPASWRLDTDDPPSWGHGNGNILGKLGEMMIHRKVDLGLIQLIASYSLFSDKLKWAYENNITGMYASKTSVQNQQHNSWAINGITMSSPVTLTTMVSFWRTTFESLNMLFYQKSARNCHWRTLHRWNVRLG